MDKFLLKLVNIRYLKWGAAFTIVNGLYFYQSKAELPPLKQSWSRYISRQTGCIGELTIPTILRNPLFSLYGYVYDVKYEDMVDPDLQNYTSFQNFFTRAVKQREFNPTQDKLIVPADSTVLSFAEITNNSTLLVKDINYSLGHFLTGQENYDMTAEILKTVKKREGTKLYSVIFYLAPGDYHRYHSPTDLAVQSRNHVLGHLAPVKVSHISKTPGVYENNERVALFANYPFGFMSMVMVGALNVGSMTLGYDKEFQTNTDNIDKPYIYTHYEKGQIKINKGDEVGMFRLGSTVVLIFEAQDVKWSIIPGQKCRWGDVFAEVK